MYFSISSEKAQTLTDIYNITLTGTKHMSGQK